MEKEALKCAVCGHEIGEDEEAYCYLGGDNWFCEECKKDV